MSNIDMTEAEVKLADLKMRAEIDKLIAANGSIGINTILVPFLTAAGVIGATAAVVIIFLA